MLVIFVPTSDEELVDDTDDDDRVSASHLAGVVTCILGADICRQGSKIDDDDYYYYYYYCY